ncbi:MAG: type II toxin-antitoxin system prevent-host-death family antitoxin [Deltaproteobacteria bacterium]|nr:type II toxin-antitoxin system prevent-host-death family antitoxin [Deltaproteobacteria bacterium]
MNIDFCNLLKIEFLPLSEVKAKLSEQIKKLAAGKRVAVTSNGRPVAVLMDYEEYLAMAGRCAGETSVQPDRTLDYESWLRSASERQKISESINRLFDVDRLARKGQKAYKREKVDGFSRP